MILKMKFLSITGPRDDIDRVVEQYLSRYEIHLENALEELKTVQTLTPFMEINPYRETLQKAEALAVLLPEDCGPDGRTVSAEDALSLIESLQEPVSDYRNRRQELLEQRQAAAELAEQLEPFRRLPVRFPDIAAYRFMHYRFGRISKEFFEKFEGYIYENSDSVFYQCHEDPSYVWGVYFTPRKSHQKTDAMYQALHFEQIYLPEDFDGTPQEEYDSLLEKTAGLDRELEALDAQIGQTLRDNAAAILAARDRLRSCSRHFDVRRLAACTRSDSRVFYILCGWMTEEDAAAFQAEIRDEPDIFCMIEDDDTNIDTVPPTILKNPKIFRPFELFIRMYGLPGYNEYDPTVYLAVTYAFIFGIMFGDVGQGLCLVAGGLLLYRLKHMPLAGIIGISGICSVIFGLIYNSFFGFEDFFPYHALLHAREDMVTLPVLGSINMVFVLSIALGMVLILADMILSVANAARRGDKENIWFGQNAAAGIVFYGSIAAMAVLAASGHGGLHTAFTVLAVLAAVGIAVVFLREMFGRLAERKHPVIEGSKPMYFVQSFFETFESLLSYLSNTLSYVRIGAYAVSHVAMMQVVMMLAGAADGSAPNIFILVIGNLFVMIMEGLMVGIQVLRLEYYEMFSRFYSGSGKEFRPFIRREEQY